MAAETRKAAHADGGQWDTVGVGDIADVPGWNFSDAAWQDSGFEHSDAERAAPVRADSATAPAPAAWRPPEAEPAQPRRRTLPTDWSRPPADPGAVLAPEPHGRFVYAPGDPALRLLRTFEFPDRPGRRVSNAIVTLSGIRDGESEILRYDLSGIKISASLIALPMQGFAVLNLQGDANLGAYARLLSSVRYLNRSPNPSGGDRAITFELMGPGHRLIDVRTVTVHVDGTATPAARTAVAAPPAGHGRRLPPDAAALTEDEEYAIFRPKGTETPRPADGDGGDPDSAIWVREDGEYVLFDRHVPSDTPVEPAPPSAVDSEDGKLVVLPTGAKIGRGRQR